MLESGNAFASVSAGLVAGAGLSESIPAPHFLFGFRCYGPDGALRWAEDAHNIVTTGGKNSLLDNYFAGSVYTAAFKLGLKGAGTAVVGDTLASHAGWAEANPYAGNRPALVWSAASGASKAATALTYTITGTATVAGAFVTDQATGTAGLLYSAGDFAPSRSVLAGDSLVVSLAVSV